MKKIIFFNILILAFNLVVCQTVNKNYVDGEIYVKFSPSALKNIARDNPNNIQITKLGSVSKVLFKYGATKANKPFYQADDDAKLPYILKIQFSQINEVDGLIRELQATRGVEYAEKVILNKTSITPNDPTFSAHLTQINATNAWNIFNSTSFGTSTITCAIIDNAVDISHPDLAANVWVNPNEIAGNGIDDDANGYIDDVNGFDVADNDNDPIPTNTAMRHGTHCAGIAGGVTDNGIGMASIGWNIKIIPVKCTTDGGNINSIDNGFAGIIYAAKVGARIISCSWGGTGGPTAAIQAVIDYAWNKGCIVICAAGNDNNSTLHYPAALNNVYSVASLNSSDVKSSFSCFGTWVDIAAPGEGIISTTPANGYMSLSGTSMATPLVAGLAALMLSKTPFMTQNDVLNCLSTTAANIYTIAGNSSYVTGNQLGAGRIEAFQAMNCAAGFSNTPVVSNFYSLIKNTCPNTPIVFTDSSLYMPTAWSWTFQAGVPATSTSSAPSVQWATPGTYSVALNATNANGGSTVTKTGYITIAGPIALPFSEGFQGATFVPSNWINYNVDNDNVLWTKSTSYGGFGASSSSALFNNFILDGTNKRDEIRTPKFNFSSIATATLGFDVAYKTYNNFNSDTLEVKLSTDCGVTWTSIYNKGGSTLSTSPGNLQSTSFTPSPAAWRTETVNISALTTAQSNVMISFVNRGHFGQALYLDNVNLATIAIPSPTANFNVTSSICSGAVTSLTNSSSGATSYSWIMTGGTPATSTATNPTVSYTAAGIYSITLVASGSLTSTFTKTLSVLPTPIIAVTDQTICAGLTATINASGATTYSWNTGSNASSIVVSPSVSTNYTVIGSTGACSSVANISIGISSPTITNVIATNPTCFGNCNGIITASTAGGTPPYIYLWSNSSTTNTISGLCSGTYSCVVTDAYNCTSSTSVNIASSTSLTSIATHTNASCSTCPDGIAFASVTGGVGPYTYTWLPSGGNTALVVNLAPVCYTVNISDAQGCNSSAITCVTITTTTDLSKNSGTSNLLSIFPNPAQTQVIINYPNTEFDYRIYNDLGQLIESKQHNINTVTINVNNFAKGVFLVEVKIGKESSRKKLIIGGF
jgi:serine protease